MLRSLVLAGEDELLQPAVEGVGADGHLGRVEGILHDGICVDEVDRLQQAVCVCISQRGETDEFDPWMD